MMLTAIVAATLGGTLFAGFEMVPTVRVGQVTATVRSGV